MIAIKPHFLRAALLAALVGILGWQATTSAASSTATPCPDFRQIAIQSQPLSGCYEIGSLASIQVPTRENSLVLLGIGLLGLGFVQHRARRARQKTKPGGRP